MKGNEMTNELGKYEMEYPIQEINETNSLEAMLIQFRNNARAINEITNETSPVEILAKFSRMRHALSFLQDDLIAEVLKTLNVVKENN